MISDLANCHHTIIMMLALVHNYLSFKNKQTQAEAVKPVQFITSACSRIDHWTIYLTKWVRANISSNGRGFIRLEYSNCLQANSTGSSCHWPSSNTVSNPRVIALQRATTTCQHRYIEPCHMLGQLASRKQIVISHHMWKKSTVTARKNNNQYMFLKNIYFDY